MTDWTGPLEPVSLVRALRGAVQTLLIVLGFVALGASLGWLSDTRTETTRAPTPMAIAASGPMTGD